MNFYNVMNLVDTCTLTLTPYTLTGSVAEKVTYLCPFLTFSSYLYLKDYITIVVLNLTSLDIFEYQTLIKNGLVFQTDTTPVMWFTLKVVLSICLLITIRGGVPRYRYDFLTKLGWVKFLTLVVTLFYITLLLKLFY